MKKPFFSPTPMESRRSELSKGVTITCLVGSACLVTLSAQAQTQPQLSPALDRFSLSVGTFRAEPTFGARVNSSYGALDTGDVKSGSVTMPRLTGDLILFNSQGLSFDYFQYKRSYSENIGGAYWLRPNQIAGNAKADLDTKLEFAKLTYKWWIGSGNTVVGVGAGAGYYKIDLDARGSATLNNKSASFGASESADAIAPLLEIGVRHAISPDLRVFADASGVWKDNGKVHGSIYNAAVGVEWSFLKNVGLTLAYAISDIDLKREDNFETRLRVKLQGPTAAIKARF